MTPDPTTSVRPRSTHRRRRGDDGAALVEFALILPLLLMLILGMFSGGLAYNQKQQLTHATREGARFGATIPAEQDFASGTWAENVAQLVKDRALGDLDGSDVVLCVSLVEGSPPAVVTASGKPQSSFSTSGAPCIPGETYPTTSNDLGRRVQVHVTRPGSIQLGVFPDISFTMDARATAKSESAE